MKLVADHSVYSEPHDSIIIRRDIIKTRQIYNLDEFPLATKDPKDSGVTRNGKKVTVRMTSQAPAFSLREFKVKKGDEVTIILTNLDKVEDLTHAMAIPKYDINFIVNPQQTQSVTFIADKPGVLVLLHQLLSRASPRDALAHDRRGLIRRAQYIAPASDPRGRRPVAVTVELSAGEPPR